ncbi:MAG: hypothetical protein HY400_04805, partial [Elusimicrobia bacterium]|nr:hypothetical protein [Elusimicrobiota bacterium]
ALLQEDPRLREEALQILEANGIRWIGEMALLRPLRDPKTGDVSDLTKAVVRILQSKEEGTSLFVTVRFDGPGEEDFKPGDRVIVLRARERRVPTLEVPSEKTLKQDIAIRK